MWKTWLIIAIIFFILEAMGPGFLLFWVGIGALISMIVSIFIDNIAIQVGIFTISSTILLFCTRSFANKLTKNDNKKTNSYSFIGQKGIVIKEINPITGSGQIKVNGEIWSANSSTNEIITEGSEIIVLEIRGVKTIVKKLEKNSEEKAIL